MSNLITEEYYSLSFEATQLGGITVTSTDGATDANMLALAEALKTWSTNYPTNIGITVTKVAVNQTNYVTDLTASPPAFD